MKINFGFWLILTGIIFCCCKKDVFPEYSIKKQYATPEGGTIEYGNVKLSFSEGSVSEKSEIIIRNIDSLSTIKYADSINFFRYLISISPENTEFLKPVSILITDDKYFYKVFDDDDLEVSFDWSDLRLYKLDLENKNIFCLNVAKVESTDTLSLQSVITQPGYYAIGISKNKIKYHGGYFIATISSSSQEIYDTTFRFDSRSRLYSWCMLANNIYSNNKNSNIQISDNNFNTVFYIETSPALGLQKIIWNDKNYFLLHYMQFDAHRGIDLNIEGIERDEGVINFTKIGNRGDIIEGTLKTKGITKYLISNQIVQIEIFFSVVI